MYKIVYIVSTFKKGGPSNQLFNIIKNLDRDTFTPYIITLSPEPENSMINNFKTLKCEIISLNLNRIEGFLSAKRKIQSLFKRIKPDIIHTSGIRSDSICQKIIDKKKHVLSIRNYPREDYIAKYGIIRGNFLAVTHFNIIKKADYAITCSRRLSHKFRANNNIQLRYIHNGVDTDIFVPVKNDTKKNRLKKKHGYKPTDCLVLSMGALIPRKNTETIIKAFMHNRDGNLKLLILGDGSERAILESLAQNDKRIRFFGDLNDVTEFLQLCDFFVSASFSEGLPNSIMEAMACGVPVILSDIEAHRELLETSKWFFKPDNVNELLTILNTLHESDRNTVSLEMKQIINQHFTARIMSEHYQKLYKEMIQG
ncbi:MAG: glycosyltransferase family 4 protein [Spirochaetales bacterium]|nr:glycosyltransferase family 4 protein [Spirochaetales bacterium]